MTSANRPTSGPATLTLPRKRVARPNVIATVFKRYTTLLILIALLCVFSLLSLQFLTSLNLKNLLVVQVTVCCMAFAAILPLIVGEFDLSLGYALGFIMMLGAFLGGFGFGAATIIPAMLVAGACIGITNGLLRISFNISSFIATLGVGIVLSGITQGMSGGAVLDSGIPPILTATGQHEFLGFKIPAGLTRSPPAKEAPTSNFCIMLILCSTGRTCACSNGSRRAGSRCSSLTISPSKPFRRRARKTFRDFPGFRSTDDAWLNSGSISASCGT
jgi:hypothetical protein